MPETKTTSMRRMGQERWKYLDMANLSFAAGAWFETKGYINSFLETIKDESDESKEIKTRFDEIEMERRTKIRDLEDQIKDLGYLEQKDYKNKGRDAIEVDAIHDQIAACWTVSMSAGLFSA